MNVPQVRTVKSRPLGTIQNTVLVQLSTGAITRVEVVGYHGNRSHRDIFGESGIQASHPSTGSPCSRSAEVCDLTESVHARISASCAAHRHGFLRQLEQGGFDSFLDGGLIRLPLPAGIA